MADNNDDTLQMMPAEKIKPCNFGHMHAREYSCILFAARNLYKSTCIIFTYNLIRHVLWGKSCIHNDTGMSVGIREWVIINTSCMFSNGRR